MVLFFRVVIDRTFGAVCVDMRRMWHKLFWCLMAILLLRLQIHAFCPETFVFGLIILTLHSTVRIHMYFPFYECICEQIIHNSIYIKWE